MQELKSWTVPGEQQLVITVHRPAVTLRCGDGPEVELNQQQVAALSDRLLDVENYLDTGDAAVI